jgi:hypothetical protein
MDIELKEISELEIPQYAPIFSCIFQLFGDYVGIYFKISIDGVEKILQRRDDMFVLYSILDDGNVSYEMFMVDEEYKVCSAGFDKYEMHTISGDRVVQEKGSKNLESLVFIKRNDGGDSDGYDGSVGYVQYNQEKDVRLMLIYQQMYNSMEKVYSFHVNKNPFQILIEKGVAAKQRGSIIPVRSTRYIRCDYDERDYNLFYNLAIIKDYGLQEFMEKGAYALHRESSISRYQKILGVTASGYAVTGFPLCRQYKYEDFSDMFEEYGFKNKIPNILLSIQNGEFDELNYYQEIANFMKKEELNPPEEVIELSLKFEGNGDDGKDS